MTYSLYSHLTSSLSIGIFRLAEVSYYIERQLIIRDKVRRLETHYQSAANTHTLILPTQIKGIPSIIHKLR